MRDHRFAHLSYVNGILSFNELFFIEKILNRDLKAFIFNYLANTILSYLQHWISLIISKHFFRTFYSFFYSIIQDGYNEFIILDDKYCLEIHEMYNLFLNMVFASCKSKIFEIPRNDSFQLMKLFLHTKLFVFYFKYWNDGNDFCSEGNYIIRKYTRY